MFGGFPVSRVLTMIPIMHCLVTTLAIEVVHSPISPEWIDEHSIFQPLDALCDPR